MSTSSRMTLAAMGERSSGAAGGVNLPLDDGLLHRVLFGDGAAGDDGDVVVLRGLALVGLDLADEEREELAGALVGELLAAQVEAVLAVELLGGVHRLDH